VSVAERYLRPGHLLRRRSHGHGRQDVHSLRRGDLLDRGDDQLDIRHGSKDSVPDDADGNVRLWDVLFRRRRGRRGPGVHCVRRWHVFERFNDQLGLQHRHRPDLLPLHAERDLPGRQLLQRGVHPYHGPRLHVPHACALP
jgi:hypothetical protein